MLQHGGGIGRRGREHEMVVRRAARRCRRRRRCRPRAASGHSARGRPAGSKRCSHRCGRGRSRRPGPARRSCRARRRRVRPTRAAHRPRLRQHRPPACVAGRRIDERAQPQAELDEDGAMALVPVMQRQPPLRPEMRAGLGAGQRAPGDRRGIGPRVGRPTASTGLAARAAPEPRCRRGRRSCPGRSPCHAWCSASCARHANSPRDGRGCRSSAVTSFCRSTKADPLRLAMRKGEIAGSPAPPGRRGARACRPAPSAPAASAAVKPPETQRRSASIRSVRPPRRTFTARTGTPTMSALSRLAQVDHGPGLDPRAQRRRRSATPRHCRGR